MATHTMWAHGTAFSPPEFPSTGLDNVDNVPFTDVIGMRRGPGSFWLGEPNNSNWFHVSIPTPAVVGGNPVRLNRVFVKYLVGAPTGSVAYGASITDVQVWEGSGRLVQFGPWAPDQGRFGDHRGALDSANTFVLPNPPVVSSGIGISVHVDFLSSGQPEERNILFTAAGAEFESQSLIVSVITWLGALRRKD